MLKDRKLTWVFGYAIGIALLVAVLPSIVIPHPGWNGAYWWAYLLFIVCSGITLIGCASSMRQRVELTERLEKLEKTVEALKKQAQSECVQKNKLSEQLVGLVD
jgi:hypothetical protein